MIISNVFFEDNNQKILAIFSVMGKLILLFQSESMKRTKS